MVNHLVSNAIRRPELAIDLGTALTRVAAQRSDVLQRPSMLSGRRALDRGVIVDADAATEVLRPMLRQMRCWGMSRLHALTCAPSSLNQEERGQMMDCVIKAGATAVAVVPEALAAAIGSGIDVSAKHARLVVDMGEGLTDCAVIRGGQVVQSMTTQTGCVDFRRSISERVRARFDVDIVEDEAERLLRRVGVDLQQVGSLAANGRCHGNAAAVSLCPQELQAAISENLGTVLRCIHLLLRDLPPSYFVEVIEDGIFLTGGGALLRGMKERIAETTRVDVHVGPDPMGAAVTGARAMLPAISATNLWKK
jgi:rod shape-determining protein MreB and related proteins